VLVCKMETVFPPRCFIAMQHLLVHLPWECRVGGLVQFMTRHGLSGVLRRHSRVKRFQISQAFISHVPTT
jgi:hypothetical protein